MSDMTNDDDDDDTIIIYYYTLFNFNLDIVFTMSLKRLLLHSVTHINMYGLIEDKTTVQNKRIK